MDTLRCTDPVGGYACQLSRIVRESHDCGLKTSILYFKDSFSNLAHKSRQIVLKYVMSDKSLIPFPQLILQALHDESEHLRKFSVRSRRLPKIYRKPREFTGTIMIVERQKSDTYYPEKVGRLRMNCVLPGKNSRATS